MARYTSSFLAKTNLEQIPILLCQLVESCDFEVVYQATDYLMAREIPGQVPFSKLVTVEALVESTAAQNNEVPVTFVIKNDELPLKSNNHCQQLFQKLQLALNQSQEWRLIAAVAT
ncbi:hypothetical protein [Crocosphaera sp. XPORK-15E]|uniref:hypothetical protein n=1 Tax=Crocosphaera sp. XPORK-15E TaxID=3110247 RepID=UPI002B214121|nr:hypothetical protein [Crocosphaera sp. XPORK-15E]MEA5535313.1 hypothetical protein [Crocosphaera sp. XPORK-15E]